VEGRSERDGSQQQQQQQQQQSSHSTAQNSTTTQRRHTDEEESGKGKRESRCCLRHGHAPSLSTIAPNELQVTFNYVHVVCCASAFFFHRKVPIRLNFTRLNRTETTADT
jgi:hypothetical protein